MMNQMKLTLFCQIALISGKILYYFNFRIYQYRNVSDFFSVLPLKRLVQFSHITVLFDPP